MSRSRGRHRRAQINALREAGWLNGADACDPPALLKWDRLADKYPPGFYVYRLIDPRNGLPFYVGKGQKARAWQHERAVILGGSTGNARKDALIGDILRASLEVEIEIVEVYGRESDALDHEFRLVDSLSTLTNIMPGGIGKAETPAQIERRNRVRALKLRRLREREREAARLRHIERAKTRLLTIKGADLHQAAIEKWTGEIKESGKPLALRPRRQSTKHSKAALAEFRAGEPL